ncbi:mitochondrial import inner membrane translocase subunit TIM44-2 [Iris pallida]|uniref:Mitochondrial import inner membrane translocase subunit TIM44-2 n=1 Tax=Iris pallida TaxID=29817 RepID=A0AAX6H2D4_IRIPA|nr:mitochondrial import inner membrane translocase subunit TIM44-2 [Iris pallida]
MATSALSRALRRPSAISSFRYAASLGRLTFEHRRPGLRQLSVLKEVSKQLNSNPEIQKQLKELNEKLGVAKDELKVRTKKTTEKLQKSVDGVWAEAEATSKKVSANVKGKLSAAKEEVKETLGLGKEEASESTSTSPYSSSTKEDSYSAKDGSSSAAGAESSQCTETSTKESVGALFGKLKSTLSSASAPVSLAFQKLRDTKASELARKGYDVVKEELSSNPSSRRRVQYTSTTKSSGVGSDKTEIVFVPAKQSRLGEKWEAFKTKMQGHPLFKRVSGYSQPVVTKGQELAEDMRERWETSDHPVVHKIQDLNESVFGETATALSFKEIRRRDPSFSLPDFVAEVQEMVRPVLNAYLKGDTETLKKYCSPEVIERCRGERAAFESQNMFFDSKILHISDVDVRETKMMGSTPIIIIGFQTQQIYCIRDKEGSITAGGKDTIQTVHYAWAMQQIDIDELGEGALYPVFRLREMQQIGVQSLI